MQRSMFMIPSRMTRALNSRCRTMLSCILCGHALGHAAFAWRRRGSCSTHLTCGERGRAVDGFCHGAPSSDFHFVMPCHPTAQHFPATYEDTPHQAGHQTVAALWARRSASSRPASVPNASTAALAFWRRRTCCSRSTMAAGVTPGMRRAAARQVGLTVLSFSTSSDDSCFYFG